jgi:signal peptide peptidase SppA
MISAFYRVPWALTPEWMDLGATFYGALRSSLAGGRSLVELRGDVEALAARTGQRLGTRPAVEVRDGVGIISIFGPLFRHASDVNLCVGGASYAALRKDLQAAIDDPAVKAILLNIDSPGGEANGCKEMGDAIAAAGDRKPIWAYVGGYGCSAAYWLASAADRIVCADTGYLGSVGVRLRLVDDTKKQDLTGEKVIDLVSKNAPGKRMDPSSDEDLARLQAMIDDLEDVFVADVARNRGLKTSAITSDFGQGDILRGPAAVKAGLADDVGDYESTLAALAATTNQGANQMDQKRMAAAVGLPEAATEAEIEARISALAGFESDALAATGAASAAEASGKIRAGAESLVELGRVRAEAVATLAAARQKEFRAALATAIDAGRLTLGQLEKVIPTFLGEERTKVAAALAAIPEGTPQTADALLDVVCTASVGGPQLEAVKAYLDAQGPQLPAPRGEQPAGKKVPVVITAEQAASMGLTLDQVDRYTSARTVADLHPTAPKGA